MTVTGEDLDLINKKFSGKEAEKLYGAGLLFNCRQNSGSRIIMDTAFIGEQWVIPNNPETPFIYTGYEKAFGKYADSIIKAKNTVEVITVISKFPNMPRHIYFYVVRDMITGVYDIIDVCHYESYAECHGHIKPQSNGDLFQPGMIIPKDTILAKAPTIDEYGNYRIGKNVNMCFASWPEVEEDQYLMRKGFAKEFTYTQIEKHGKTYNRNDIGINRYGKNGSYKMFPDIGEEVEDGIICSTRQINYTFAASELTEEALKRDLDSDSATPGRGKIIDIDVYVNDEKELENNPNRSQIIYYWMLSKHYHQTIVNELGKIVNNKKNRYSELLKDRYQRSLMLINGDINLANNNGVFEFAYVEFTTAYEACMTDGSKITDRSASKGVCKLIDDEMMPRDKYGNVADIVESPPGIVGRANVSQTYEPELNYIAFFVRKNMAEAASKGIDIQYGIYYEFMKYVDIDNADSNKAWFYSLSEIDKSEFIADIIINGIYIRQSPMFGNVTYEMICYLYDKYDIHPDKVRVQREIKKHGFNKDMLAKVKNKEFSFFFNNKGEIINKYFLPEDVNSEENKQKAREFFGDDEYIYSDEYVTKGENEDSEYLIKDTGNGKTKALMPVKDKTIDEMINENWHDDTTYLVGETEDTIKLSFLTQEPLIIAPKYFVILKHVPEGKLSARYIGSTSPTGLPNKTGKTESNGPISGTPIKYGEMELFNALIRVDPLIVYRNLSVMSKNPALRAKLFNILLFDNPLSYHNIPVPITDVCNDIPAKVFEAYLFCLGLEVIDTEEPDIYSVFDEYDDLTDEQLDEIMRRQYLLYPPTQINRIEG